MVRPPLFARWIMPQLTWRMNNDNNNVFISFDDGPIPEVTPWVLDEADRWEAKLTFFCVGENVQKHTDIYNEIINRGHRVGNHTYNHMQAWHTPKKEYFENINKASGVIETNLFRPPHGQIYPWYLQRLRRSFDKVVMWDVLSKDYDSTLTGQEVFNNIKRNVRPGSILVFHDSLKAEKNMKYAFPKTLEMLSHMGLKSVVIE